MHNGSVTEDVYTTNNQYILTNDYKPDHDLTRYYNFPINHAVSDQVIVHQIQYSYRRQWHSYMLNLGTGVILLANDDLRYFRAHNNMQLLDTSLFIWNGKSLQSAIDALQNMDINDLESYFCSNSWYTLVFLTNLEY